MESSDDLNHNEPFHPRNCRSCMSIQDRPSRLGQEFMCADSHGPHIIRSCIWIARASEQSFRYRTKTQDRRRGPVLHAQPRWRSGRPRAVQRGCRHSHRRIHTAPLQPHLHGCRQQYIQLCEFGYTQRSTAFASLQPDAIARWRPIRQSHSRQPQPKLPGQLLFLRMPSSQYLASSNRSLLLAF